VVLAFADALGEARIVPYLLRLIAGLFGAIACVHIGAGPAGAEKRVALVIGNSTYLNAGALPNPKEMPGRTLQPGQPAFVGGGSFVAASWSYAAVDLRTASRDWGTHDGRLNYIGLRVVRTL
jgi:hypothetical protein